MLQHPAELIREIHQEDLLAEQIESQAEYIKEFLFKDGVVDVGRGVTDNYTLEAVLSDYPSEYLFRILADLYQNKDNDLKRHQAVNKLISSLDESVNEASSFQAKILKGVNHAY